MGASAILRQLSALGLGLALWSLLQVPALWTLLLAYALGVWIAGALRFGEALASMPRGARALILGALLLPGGLGLWRAGPAIATQEGLSGLWPGLRDRLRLEALPAIAPAFVSGAEAQTFYVRADASEGEPVRLQLGPRAKPLVAEALGAGLFRVDYDPRKDGPPYPPNGTLSATVWVGERAARRELHAATPLAHPRWFARAPNGQLAATVSSESDELVIVSARGLERRVPVGDAPSDCVFLDDARIAVSHDADARVWVIDAGSGERVRQLNGGDRQGRLALAPDGTRLVLARGGLAPELVVLDPDSGEVVQKVPLPAAADWIAFGPDGDTLLVATRADARLLRLRARDGALRSDAALALGRPAVALARARDGRSVLLATTDHRASGAHLGNHFVQDQLLLVDVATLSVVRTWMTAQRSPRQSKPGDVDRGLSPLGLAPAADGSWLIAFAGSEELGRVSAGGLSFDRPGPEELREGAATPQMGGAPTASPPGREGRVPFPIENMGGAPTASPAGREGRVPFPDVGLYAPHGVVELADGSIVVSSPASGALALWPRAGPARVLRLAPDDGYLRAHDREALAQRLGERGFYEGTRAGISCQSCHLHADSDLSAHNLGDRRLLPTLSVRGLAGTAPYLRDGSYPELGDLDHVAQLLYRGYLRHAPARKQTLQAYLAALPRARPARPAGARDLAAERRGVDAFVAARCPTCHAFPAFTQLSAQRPAALFPDQHGHEGYELLDVPSLLSSSASPPYLSDGRARTLAAVLGEHNRSNRHGDSARLSPAQRGDLVRWLEGL